MTLHPNAKRLGRFSGDKWLEARRKGIGGSDAGVITGSNPYETAHALYLDKTGIEPNTFAGNHFTRVGQLLEEHIMNRVAPEALPGEKVGLLQSKTHPFLLANCDGFEPHRLVEIKTSGKSGWRKIPAYYIDQCQHYMLVTGQPETLLVCAAVQVDRFDAVQMMDLAQARPELVVEHLCKIKTYKVEANEDWQAEYISKAQAFWRKVEARQWEEKAYAF